MSGGRAVLIVSCTLGAACSRTERPPDFSAVAAVNARLTLATDPGGADSLSSVERARLPDLYYRVTLSPAPVGAELPLTCDWLDPAGHVAHQNHYRTRRIDHDSWPTWCHHLLGAGAATGSWRVRMTLEGRVLSETGFDLR